MGWTISKSEYEKLLSFFGYGDFEKADIVLLGIEEGMTAGMPAEANIRARCEAFGKDESGEYVHCVEAGEWESGFYEKSGPSGLDKVLMYAGVDDYKAKMASFLRMIAQFMLSLENPEQFERYFEMGNQEVREYSNQILVPREGVSTALMDWRPLPRRDENTWYEEYAPISKELYLDAFRGVGKRPHKDEFSDYDADTEARRDLFERVLERFKPAFLVTFGDMPVHKGLVETVFPSVRLLPMHFASHDVDYGWRGQITYDDGRTTNIFVLPFPSNRGTQYSPWGSKYYGFFKEFVQHYMLKAWQAAKKA